MLHYFFAFGGRINRAKMWLFYFLAFPAIALPVGLDIWLTKSEGVGAELRMPTTLSGAFVRFVIVAWVLLFLYVYLAVAVKRLHDRGKSATWLAVFFGIPISAFALAFYVGSPPRPVFPGASIVMRVAFFIAFLNNIWYLVELFILRGTRGDNRFGPDPLAKLV